jgi:DNA-binding HxlR family transcriptional regulator
MFLRIIKVAIYQNILTQPDISQKMLSSSLKHPDQEHLLKRKAFAEIPPRVEYSLTELGLSLMPIIGQMIEWAQVHFDEVTK